MNLFVLIVRNRLSPALVASLDAVLEQVKEYFAKRGITVQYEFSDTSIETPVKDFGVTVRNWGTHAGGLDGVRTVLERRHLVPNYAVHEVWFIYDAPNWPENLIPAAWTHFNDIYKAAFVECPAFLASVNILTHEAIHGMHRLAWWSGYPTQDTLDQYDKEDDLEAPDGNRARNLDILKPYLPKILGYPLWHQLENLKKTVQALLESLRLKTPKAPLERFADAIQKYEGYYVPGEIVGGVAYPNGSTSYRNHNPGNIKFIGQAGTFPDARGFAVYPSYGAGYAALLALLRNAATGKSTIYNPEDSLFTFFEKYAEDVPSTAVNESRAYALFVSRELGVPPTTPIRNLV